MKWYKRNRFIAVMVLSAGAIVGVQSWLWWQARRSAAQSLSALQQKRQELAWLQRQTPAPTRGNAQLIADELNNAGEQAAKLRKELLRRQANFEEPFAATEPATLYFEIADFVERARALAAGANVTLAKDERFGFSTYANEGPEVELAPAVHRQRLYTEHLVETVIAARPSRFLSVKRERPRRDFERSEDNLRARGLKLASTSGAPSAATGKGATADFFELEKELSMHVPGVVTSTAVRVEFVGRTEVLRSLLNALAEAPHLSIVRKVEVEPWSGARPFDAQSEAEAGKAVPIIDRNFSKFAVVVEFVSLVIGPDQSLDELAGQSTL